MMKFDRRLVARETLTDLEHAILDLEEFGWELDPTVPDENSGTLLGALRAIRARGLRANIVVPMRRRIE